VKGGGGVACSLQNSPDSAKKKLLKLFIHILREPKTAFIR
jgi:hypothetical protein